VNDKRAPFCTYRYTDSPDGDWVIGFHPLDSSVVLATAGSGHAYKVRAMCLVPHAFEDAQSLILTHTSSFRSSDGS
jgi:hypothetical protein